MKIKFTVNIVLGLIILYSCAFDIKKYQDKLLIINNSNHNLYIFSDFERKSNKLIVDEFIGVKKFETDSTLNFLWKKSYKKSFLLFKTRDFGKDISMYPNKDSVGQFVHIINADSLDEYYRHKPDRDFNDYTVKFYRQTYLDSNNWKIEITDETEISNN